MKIRIVSLYVDDQEKALHFYTDKLGFVKKSDITHGGYRWLTVVAAEDPSGVELDDINREYQHLRAVGVTFTMPPTKTTRSTIAILDDTCGNLIQLTQLDAGSQ